MEAIGLLVTLEARAGKEADAEAFLKSAQPLALNEKGTLKWYAFKIGPAKFGIFDTFANEAGRNAHLTGGDREGIGSAGQRIICGFSAGGKSGNPCKHTLKRLSRPSRTAVVGSSYVQVCRHHPCRDLAVSAPRGGNHAVSSQLPHANGSDERHQPLRPSRRQGAGRGAVAWLRLYG